MIKLATQIVDERKKVIIIALLAEYRGIDGAIKKLLYLIPDAHGCIDSPKHIKTFYNFGYSTRSRQ